MKKDLKHHVSVKLDMEEMEIEGKITRSAKLVVVDII